MRTVECVYQTKACHRCQAVPSYQNALDHGIQTPMPATASARGIKSVARNTPGQCHANLHANCQLQMLKCALNLFNALHQGGARRLLITAVPDT
jgi:hypothetical protein